ncbi:MAG: hypothetical protein E7256_02260 [Lachnospiraceae bacterium]|nr:hypothetical protein [Lachnospiraceae bacterium]
MEGKCKHYFACGNTAKGFVNYFQTNIETLPKLFILKGGPGTGKSTLMRKIGDLFSQYDREYIHCSSDPESLDGIIIRELGVGIVDGTAPHVIEPKAPGAVEEYINLGQAWNTEMLEEHAEEIKQIQAAIAPCYQKAYQKFGEALKIHDEWEKVYISQMDYDKADELANQVITMILGNKSVEKKGQVYHRFFGGSTPFGPMDYVENITKDISIRYFIKGRPGSGKSTMLKKILAKAENRGFDVEVYHCGFDPNSLDMILLPELSLCIFDSTAPHEYEPNRPGDSVIDMYAEIITPGTDEANREVLSDIVRRYKQTNQEGIAELKKAKDLHDKLEGYYIKATDFEKINALSNELIEKIKKREA